MKNIYLKRCIGLLSLLLIIPVWVYAQNVTVKGTVKDSNGESMPGVNVLQAGTTNGIITDVEGNYQLNVPSNAKLIFSFIGYVTQTVPVAGKTTLNIVMKEDAQALEEVVVVGYGTMKKSDIAGSVASVDRESMMRKAPTNIAQGLQGAAPGVMVTMQDGAPDANAAVRIRGVATINGKADPLYVVDGIQVGTNANFVNPSDIESIEVLKDASATAIYGSAGANGVIMITTKHGTKGHSSVTITADFGLQTLPNKLDVCSVDQYASNIRTARANDGVGLWNEVWSEKYDGKRKFTDWQDVMTRSSWKQNYNISTSGGSDKTQYNASVGFLRNDGVVINTQYQRITARANVKSQINKYLEFGADVSYVHTDSHGSNNSIGNFGNLSSLRDFAFMCPSMDFVTRGDATYDGVPAGTYISPNVVNPDGTFGEVLGGKDTNDGFWGTIIGNIYAKQMELQGRNRNNRALASAYLTITPLKGLSWKTLVSYSYYSGSSNNFSGGIKRFNYYNGQAIDVTKGTNAYVNPSNDNDYSFSIGNNDGQTLSIQNTLTYGWKNDIHDLTLMLGNEVSRYYGQWTSAASRGFWSKDNRDVGLTTKPETLSGSGALNLESRGISYFGRASYSLLNRYILTATIRRDGSSNFGAGNRWGTFPSAALAWRISEEGFMKNQDVVSNLKLRLGWGQTGNSGGATDLSVVGLTTQNVKYSFYNSGQGMGKYNGMTFDTGYYAKLVDTNLKWETNEQMNIGLDASFLQGDLNLTMDYFIRTSKDLLLYRQVRPSTGFSDVYTNYGEIENKGFEFSLAYNKRLNKDWSINATLTGSTLKNKVKKMGEPLYNTNSDSSGRGTEDGSNTGAVGAADGYHWGNHSICKEGYAVGSFYGYRVIGIYKSKEDLEKYPRYSADTQIGDYIFADLNDDKVIDAKDMDILGDGFPALNYGLNLGANYKNWDFSVYLYGVSGQKIFSYSAMRLSNMFASDDGCAPNILKESAAAAYHPENNPNGTLSRLSFLDKNNNMRASDMWIKNGDFLRISNIQIGYTLPKNLVKKASIQSARVYLSIQNLATISGYNKYGDPECGQGSVLYTGLDTGRYPMPRTYTLGFNVQF
ncbi:SusC/RagA family TonB-linked outer membrane protein [Bacteroides heparinolyticus]|uniref:SusC/RagA family TonB-linked outer membrane protein n=2 Tax=Prevotella heparinolytica TaxID=28113 RepID=UPI0023EFBEA5|nr:TonB-dependent receptor [Bacteroides heparinolyticus]